ncbi:MAG: TonB-dependent receptor [Gemmatimonadetes bacterium]|nr:TonB-dependent receptor [Gemmatimonadota bacterium]
MQNWFGKVLPAVAALFATALMVGTLSAQGVTTGAASGVITDQDGNPLAGATVEFTHVPTGFRTTAVTNVRGIFTVQGLEPGGPYTVRIRQIGYRPVTQERIFIALGQTFRLNTGLQVTAVELEDITVVADPMAAEFAPTRQGTRTTINEEQLHDLPTLNRRFTDLAKLTPQIVSTDANQGQGISVIGQNNRFNTIQIDGSTVNDRFGLGATGTAGGQARGKPIGYDAVKEYQVELAPYDVRQGNFTGALINAITKSGTNRWQGSAFGYFRNQNTVGNPLGCAGAPDPCGSEFSNYQFGGSLGGPIVRDKAHFFTNLEFQRSTTPASGAFLGGSVSGLQPDQGDVDAFNQALLAAGMTEGSAARVDNENPLTNFMARVDWGMGSNSRLVFRYSYNKATDDIFSRTSSSLYRLDVNGYQFRNNTHNPSFQWFSNFSNGSSNEFRLSYNRIRDERDPNVKEPQVAVFGFTNSAGDSHGFEAGSEEFSQGNRLDQDIIELTDNYTLSQKGDHRITVGTRNEFYRVVNLFAQQSFGNWGFPDTTAFRLAGLPGGVGQADDFEVSAQRTGGPVQPASFKSATIGLYAQDQWQLTPKFNLTYGLRVDIPVFFDQPTYDPQVNADFGNTDVPSGQLLWSPRAGFNWDIDGLGNQQLRGGLGIFTGNPAFVWMSNAYSNNGTGITILGCSDFTPSGAGGPPNDTPVFSPDPNNQPLSCVNNDPTSPGFGGPGNAIGQGNFLGEVDIVGNDTKYPQVFRANLAYDRRLPEDFILTLEGMYNKGINDYFITNLNLPADSASTGANGRTVYGPISSSGRSNPRYFNSSVYGTFNGGVYHLGNTSNNWSANFTVGLQKSFGQDFRVAGFYTYSQAKDVQSFTSSRAISNWRFARQYSGSQFDDEATLSAFDRTNKVTLSGTYLFPWQKWQTQISLTYIGMSGTPYTYISGGSSGRGDLNGDGQNGNDPLYVIRDANDPGMQWDDRDPSTGFSADATAYNDFIAQTPCMNKQRGTISQRSSCRNPWQNFLDMNLRQALPAMGNNLITLEVGVFNVLNLLDGDWGQIKTAGGGVFPNVNLIDVVSATNGVPNFVLDSQFPTNDGDPANATFTENGDPRSSWQLQVSLRYEYGQGIF